MCDVLFYVECNEVLLGIVYVIDVKVFVIKVKIVVMFLNESYGEVVYFVVIVSDKVEVKKFFDFLKIFVV